MAVRIAASVRADVIAHAREEAPDECCGLLIGDQVRIDGSVRARNLHPQPSSRYLLDPAAHIAANRQLRGTTRSVIGFYHSHPASEAVPSRTDQEEACYPALVWMIVSLAAARPEIGLYRIDRGEVTKVLLIEE